MAYELVKLSGPLLQLSQIESKARAWCSDELIGCWRSEIGLLGQLILLRRFDSKAVLEKERQRALLDPNPFNNDGLVERLEMESFECFPFVHPPSSVTPAALFEIRTYYLKPGGLAATLKGWKTAIPDAKEYTDHLLINMYATDGRPRIVHIWSFDSFEQRLDLRQRHYAAKTWPPPGGPENIQEAHSVIAFLLER